MYHELIKFLIFNWDGNFTSTIKSLYFVPLPNKTLSLYVLCCNNFTFERISVIMNSLQIVLVFSLSIAFAFADPPSQSQSPVVLVDKDTKATEECNATIPVQRHARTVLGSAIATGSTFWLTKDEKCFLNCFLQKVGFLDANTSSIRNGPGLVNYTLRHSPELVKYSDVLIAQIFQINRVTRGFTDNCNKAYVIYHQFAQNIFVLAVADGLQSYSGVKDKLITAAQTGQDANPDLSKQINEFLGFFDTLVTSIAKEAQ